MKADQQKKLIAEFLTSVPDDVRRHVKLDKFERDAPKENIGLEYGVDF